MTEVNDVLRPPPQLQPILKSKDRSPSQSRDRSKEVRIGFSGADDSPPNSHRRRLKTFSETLAKAIDDLKRGKAESSASVDENDITAHEDSRVEKAEGKHMNRLREKREAGIPHISLIEREQKRRQQS